MKIFTVPLLITCAVFFISIESSPTWLQSIIEFIGSPPGPLNIRSLRIRGYEDECHTERPLRVGTKVKIGIRKIQGDEYIVGVVMNGRIRPMFNYPGRKFIINLDKKYVGILKSDMNIPFGEPAERTLEIEIDPPERINQHLPLPPPEGHHYHQD